MRRLAIQALVEHGAAVSAVNTLADFVAAHGQTESSLIVTCLRLETTCRLRSSRADIILLKDHIICRNITNNVLRTPIRTRVIA